MRKFWAAQKQNDIANTMNFLKNEQIYFKNLPTINNRIESYQQYPKIFINSQQALIWIKKDVDKKAKRDFILNIKKKVEKQLSIEKGNYTKIRKYNPKSNYSYCLRKYSSTSKCDKNKISLEKIMKTQQSVSRSKYKNPFLSIQVLQANPKKQSERGSLRVATERYHLNYQTINKQQDLKKNKQGKKKQRIRIITNQNQNKKRTPQISFHDQYITPW